MMEHFKNPSAMRPGTSMPPILLSDAQLSSIAALLVKLNARNVSALQNAPVFAVEGARLYQANHCSACHTVNVAGNAIGPSLNGLSKRRSRSWVEQNFADPRKLSAGSIMPPYRLGGQEIENLTAYLLSLE